MLNSFAEECVERSELIMKQNIMIIIILPIILLLLLLTFFLYIQKKKVMSLQQQIGDLQNKISILEKQYLAAEQYKDSLRQEAYTVHLYASLSLEEAKKHP